MILLVCLLALPAAAQDLFPLQPHPSDTAWPTAEWERVTEMPSGLDGAAVERLLGQAMRGKKTDVMGETRAIVIVHRGRLLLEAYGDGFGPDTKQVSWSMAKSITHALVGRALELGLIEDIDAAMPSPFDGGDPRAAITWRQWLNMTDGLDYYEINATSFAGNDVVQMMFGRGKYDVLDYVREELPVLHEPGTHWNYSTAGFHTIAAALARVITADANALDPAPIPMFDFANMELFDSLYWGCLLRQKQTRRARSLVVRWFGRRRGTLPNLVISICAMGFGTGNAYCLRAGLILPDQDACE